MFLTHEELIALTGRQRARLQVEALSAMGVPFLVAPDGRPRVARLAIETLMAPGARSTVKSRVTPRFDLVT